MNNNVISPSSAKNRSETHSLIQKKEREQISKEVKAPAPAPPSQPIQYNSRSYYYDSMGGGYRGL